MNSRMFGFAFVIILCSQLIFAGEDAISTMATIMLHLNHYPSASEKDTLRKIVNNESATKNEHVLAQAMINLEHYAAPADKPKLEKIMEDKSASANERDLARIIYNIAHTPTAADKQTLQAMMK